MNEWDLRTIAVIPLSAENQNQTWMWIGIFALLMHENLLQILTYQDDAVVGSKKSWFNK